MLRVLILLSMFSHQCAENMQSSLESESPSSSALMCEGCLAASEFSNVKAGAFKWRSEVAIAAVLDDPKTMCAARNFEDGETLVEGADEVFIILNFPVSMCTSS